MGFWDDVKGTFTAATVGTLGVPGTLIGELSGRDDVARFRDVPKIYHNAFDLGAKGGFEGPEGETRTLADFPGYLADTYRDTPFVGGLAGGLVDATRGSLALVEGGADAAGGVLSAGGGLAEGLGAAGQGIGDAGRFFEKLPSILTIGVVVLVAAGVVAILAKTSVPAKVARAVKS